MSKRTRECSVENCDKSGRITRGMCNMHYMRWLRNGRTYRVNFETPEEALQHRVQRDGDCLVWTGAKVPNGYGRLIADGKLTLVHRFAYELVHGPIPEGKYVDHTCYNRACVNVSHLRVATRSQNQQNRSGANQGSVSGVRNVSRNGKGWKVLIVKDRKRHYFGTYPTIEEAASVASEARTTLLGEYAGQG